MQQLTHVFVLLAALSSVGTAQNLFFTDGNERTFEVRPSVSEKITSIIWKINGDLLAEWTAASSLVIYPRFKTRTSLDTNNGRLVMKQMTKEDVGTYTVEINNKVQSGKYDMKWIPRVNKPAVNITTCSPDSENCSVTCDGGTKEAEPIQYYWRIGSSEWESPGKDIVITKEKHGGEKDITCRMKNPVSEEESIPINNPLLPVFQQSSISGNLWVGLGVVVLAVFIIIMYFCIRPWWAKRKSKQESSSKPDNGTPSELLPKKESDDK